MRIVIFGAGAIGGLVGAHLALKNEVTLVCRKECAAAIDANGLRVTGLSDLHVRPRAVSSVNGLEPPDILFITVKAYDTAGAAAEAAAIVGPDSIIVSLQNGLGNVEAIRAAMPEANVVGGVTSHGAMLREPGVIEHTGRSYTMVGGPGAESVAEILRASGIETDVSPDIDAEIWYKAIVNSVINPLGTLLKARNGTVLERPELADIIGRIVSEAVEVAGAKGMTLDERTAVQKVMTVARETANNICSMRLDVERGRRTEIMQMNGAIAGYGGEAGIPTPVNSMLATLVRALEPGT